MSELRRYFASERRTKAPWLYVRAKLAAAWHCRPGEIDPDDDADEIGIQLALWELEHQYTPQG